MTLLQQDWIQRKQNALPPYSKRNSRLAKQSRVLDMVMGREGALNRIWKELLVSISGLRGPAAYHCISRIGGWVRDAGFHFAISVVIRMDSRRDPQCIRNHLTGNNVNILYRMNRDDLVLRQFMYVLVRVARKA